MITRLEVDGFKSLRGFAIDLGPFTALVGPNSAGKSNILEALVLLSRLASEPIEAAFKRGRGRAIDQFTLEKGEAVPAIRFAVEMLLAEDVRVPEATNRLRYELTIGRQRRGTGAESLIVEHERLATIARSQDTWSAGYPALAEGLRHAPAMDLWRQVERTQNDLRKGARRLQSREKADTFDILPDTQTLLAVFQAKVALSVWRALEVAVVTELGVKRFTPAADEDMDLDKHPAPPPNPARTFAIALAGLRLVHLDSARLHDESERIGGATLAPDASNLPTVLASLPARALGEIRADLAALVPGISTFHLVADKDSFHIEFELSGGDRLPARLMSDGTLRALALLAALRSEPTPQAIAIEEPENGIYPGRLRVLLDLLREMSSMPDSHSPLDRAAPPGAQEEEEEGMATVPPQVIVTSHSPVVLAAMRDDPSCLRFIDIVRRNGHLSTRARTVGAAIGTERGTVVSLREVDALLSLAATEAAE